MNHLTDADRSEPSPLRLLVFAAGMLAATGIAYLVCVLQPDQRWVQSELRRLLPVGAGFASALAFVAAWLQWGIRRRRRSDGALFGRHSRIGTTPANDFFVGCLLAGAVAMAVAPIDLLPVVFPVAASWAMAGGVQREAPSAHGLLGSFGQATLAIIG